MARPTTKKKAQKTKAKRPSVTDSFPDVEPKSRAVWRAWLIANHAVSTGIWLIYCKKASGLPTITYDEAVEEALCFGWIDSTMRPLDGVRLKQMFTPRKKKSAWSALNKERVEKLLAAKLIHPSGQAKIDAAKEDGSWIALDAVNALIVPADFKKAMAANPAAKKNFAAFTPGVKKLYLYRIHSARRPQTRAKRIADLVTMAARNVRRFG
jgi:uncharacterized protein YdeI (YjbR/CyaY-like superfamily)